MLIYNKTESVKHTSPGQRPELQYGVDDYDLTKAA